MRDKEPLFLRFYGILRLGIVASVATLYKSHPKPHPNQALLRLQPMAEKSQFKFTARAIKALKPGEKEQLHYDTIVPQFGLRLSPKGKVSFFVRLARKRENIKLRHVEKAREVAREKLGESVQANEIRSGLTLKEVFSHWMKFYAREHKRTWKRDEQRWQQYLTRFGSRQLHSISREEMAELSADIKENNGPYAANDTVAFMSSLYVYATDFMDWKGKNPCRRVRKYPEQDRERYLLPEEFPRWYDAVQQLNRMTARHFFLLCLWTGARRENVLSMEWAAIDLDAGIWTLRPEQVKNKRGQLVYLSEEALAILRTRFGCRDRSCGWVLPSGNGSSSGHYADPKSAWARVLELSGIKDLRIHDLRRTLGSWMAEGGTSLPIIGKTLGHQSLQATQIYARLGSTAVRHAVNDAARALKDTLKE